MSIPAIRVACGKSVCHICIEENLCSPISIIFIGVPRACARGKSRSP